MAVRKDGKPKKKPVQPYRVMTPENRALVVAGRVQEKSCREISREIGCNPKSVTNLLEKDDIKELIERSTARIINETLEPACKTIANCVKLGNDLKTCTDAQLKISADMSKHVTGIAGISGTTPSVVVNNLTQINQAVEQSEELKALSAFLMNQWGKDSKLGQIVDVEA
jgi:phage terminase small subunit